MKKTLLSIFIMLKLNFSMTAQSYQMLRGGAISEISGTGTSITDLADDNFSGPINLGFNFKFFGNTYNNLFVGSNGYVSFGTGYSSFDFSILSSNPPNNFISFAGGDLHCGVNSPIINYFTTGTAPNRIFVLNFKNVAHYSVSANTSSVQLQLYEGSNEIQMNIINVASAGYNRTIGLENIDSSIGITDPSINANISVNIVNERIKFVEYLPSCPNEVSVSSTVGSTCTDLSTTLTAAVSPAGNFNYQWYRGATRIVGANSSTYNTTIADSYFVQITGSNCVRNSTSTNVATIPQKRITGSNCVGSTLTACGYGASPIQWNKDGVPIPGETSSTFTPSQTGNYTITSTTAGRVWTSYNMSLNLSSIFHFQDANVGWAVSSNGKIIYKTIDGGANWTQQIDIASITSNTISKILSLSSNVIVAIGSQGLILRSTNGGSNWSIISDSIYNSLIDISFIDSLTGWVITNNGTLLKTINGGASWTQIAWYNAEVLSLTKISFKDASVGYAIGYNQSGQYFLIKTTDGGNSWGNLTNNVFTQYSPYFIYNYLSHLYISQSLNLGYLSGYANNGISGGFSGGLVNLDTGFSNLGGFTQYGSTSFSDIEFVNRSEGWAVEDGSSGGFITLLKTTNGGNSFIAETIQGAGNMTGYFDIQILPSGNVGWGYGDGNKYLKMTIESSPTFTIINRPPAPTLTATGNTNQLCPGQLIEVSATCAGTLEWSNGQIGNVFLHTYVANTSITATCTLSGCPSLASSTLNLNGYPTTLPLTGNATNGSQSAFESIQSSQKINSGVSTNYFAGRNISLINGFEAKNGSIFRAEINNFSCVNNNNLVLNIPFFNNVVDHSGYLRGGALQGDFLSGAFIEGRRGSSLSAIYFGGTNQYLDFGNWFNYQEFSISFWAKPSATQANPYAMLIDNNHTGSRSWVSQQNNTTTNAYYFSVNGTLQSGSVPFNLSPTAWTHLVFVKSNSEVKVYKDGVLLGISPFGGSIPYDLTQRLVLGAWYNNGNPQRFWKGTIDDLKIYSRVLTGSEVSTLFTE